MRWEDRPGVEMVARRRRSVPRREGFWAIRRELPARATLATCRVIASVSGRASTLTPKLPIEKADLGPRDGRALRSRAGRAVAVSTEGGVWWSAAAGLPSPAVTRRKGERAMTQSALPPLLSSDGHLEVRPERWTPRMPARLRELAPRTVKLPDGGGAFLGGGQEPRPVPSLDLRAGRTNETWQPFGVTVEDTAGVGPPEQRLAEQDIDGLRAEVLFPHKQKGAPGLGRQQGGEGGRVGA